MANILSLNRFNADGLDVLLNAAASGDFEAILKIYEWPETSPLNPDILRELFNNLVNNPDNVSKISNLGFCYGQGIGVAIDLEKAVDYLTQAAEQDHAPAQTILGTYYEQGIRVVIDLEKAVEYYTKAEIQGFAPAQFKLGECYAQGIGVADNLEARMKALELFIKVINNKEADQEEMLEDSTPYICSLLNKILEGAKKQNTDSYKNMAIKLALMEGFPFDLDHFIASRPMVAVDLSEHYQFLKKNHSEYCDQLMETLHNLQQDNEIMGSSLGKILSIPGGNNGMGALEEIIAGYIGASPDVNKWQNALKESKKEASASLGSRYDII